MSQCCVCRLTMRSGQNVFAEYIGDPPLKISKLLVRCTGISTLSAESMICKKCCYKLSRFYKTNQIAHRLKRELIELVRNDQNGIVGEELEEAEPRDSTDQCATLEEELLDEEEVIIQVLEGFNSDMEDEPIKVELQVLDKEITVDIKEEDDELPTQLENGAEDGDGDADSDVKYCYESVEESDLLENLQPVKKCSQITCSECGQNFKSDCKYRSHIKKEHFKGYVCEQCGKTLISKSGFLRHLESHDPANALECPICPGQHFKNKYSYKHHMAWHSGDKKFQCGVCQKRFVHSIALYKHKMIHDNQTRKLECKECGFKVRTKAHLDRHMTRHTGLKPHSCPICGKCFSLVYNMNVHIQEHEKPGSTRQRRLKCKKCTRTFINKQNYKEHCERNNCVDEGS